jgi:hypothetical protein
VEFLSVVTAVVIAYTANDYRQTTDKLGFYTFSPLLSAVIYSIFLKVGSSKNYKKICVISTDFFVI